MVSQVQPVRAPSNEPPSLAWSKPPEIEPPKLVTESHGGAGTSDDHGGAATHADECLAHGKHQHSHHSLVHRVHGHHYTHMFMLSLLGLDAFLTLCGGVLDTQYLHTVGTDCKDKVKEMCSGGSQLSSNSSSGRRLGLHSVFGFGESSAQRRLSGACDTDHFGLDGLHTAEVGCAYVSTAILSFFLLEQIILITALCGEYWNEWRRVFDLFVIVVSLVLEILVTKFKIAGGILVLARMWRFARIGHGIFEGTHKTGAIGQHYSAESIHAMDDFWKQLDDSRWEEIANLPPDKIDLSELEHLIERQINDKPGIALRALALARRGQLLKNGEQKDSAYARPGQSDAMTKLTG